VNDTDRTAQIRAAAKIGHAMTLVQLVADATTTHPLIEGPEIERLRADRNDMEHAKWRIRKLPQGYWQVREPHLLEQPPA
jgi:hypothetical protein